MVLVYSCYFSGLKTSTMGSLYVLFEHASGYALFKVKEFEEVGMLLPQVEASVTDLKRFGQVVELAGFSPFKTAVMALENINYVSEGVIPEALQTFLERILRKVKGATLGVAEAKLGAAISDACGISCTCSGAVPEILRGIRLHFAKLVKGFTPESSKVAQLGLGHSYSRAKVKFNVNRVDNMIIQSIALVDQLDKDVNTFAMRIREWYSYHFPELFKIVPENYVYSKCASYIGNRKTLDESKLDELEEIVMDRSKAEAILDASRSSMGMDISPVDLMNIELFAKRVVSLSEYRTKLVSYLSDKMNSTAPNLATLIGDQVGARLIAHAGSLTNLAKFPASTVQILGAEKALFRALKTRSNTPKYGLIYHSSFISRAETRNKGRISRFLANKCSLASRIDCFAETPCQVFGEKLKEQVEDRLKFLVTGDLPKKNIDVMKEAVEEAAEVLSSQKKKKKKKKKEKGLENGDTTLEQSMIEENGDDGEPPKKKKKKKNKTEEVNGGADVSMEGTEEPVKKKKKKKSKAPDDDE